MGKQTMGTPCHALKYRSDNKLYRIQTPQTPMVRPGMHDYYDIDNYPMGTNAVVAVISYTVSFYVGQDSITLVVYTGLSIGFWISGTFWIIGSFW